MSVRTPRPIVLTTDDVSISRTSVTLKVIQVNNRQMTQSIFRQLEVRDFFDEETLELSGVIWGYVNYIWGDMPPGTRHFVIQDGDRLYRKPFRPLRSKDFPTHYPLPAPVYAIQSDYSEEAEGLAKIRYALAIRDKMPAPGSYSFDHGFLKAKGHLDGRFVESRNWPTLERGVIETFGRFPTPGEVESDMAALAARLARYFARWDALMDRLDSIEQLFIAA